MEHTATQKPVSGFRKVFWTISTIATVGTTALAVYVGMVLMNVLLVLSFLVAPLSAPEGPLAQEASALAAGRNG